MDKKNTVIGVLLLVAAMAAFYISARMAPPAPTKQTTTTNPVAKNEAPVEGPAKSPADATLTAPTKSTAPAEFVTLQNAFIAVKFTTAGGAIDSIELLKHRAYIDQTAPYTLNRIQAAPALSLIDFPGVDKDARYELVSHTGNEVVYRAVLDGKLEVTRRYSLLGDGKGDPYQIRHETTFRNLTDQTLPLPRGSIHIGTASPLNENDNGLYLNVGYYNGDKAEFVRRDELAGGGFFTQSPPLPHLDKTAAIQWASVKNQFFAMILTLDQPGTGVRIERVKVDPMLPAEDRRAFGVAAAAQFELKPLAPNASTVWGATYFAGAKEYARLSKTDNFKHSEDLVMQFSTGFGKVFFSGFFSPLLLTIMNWVHTWVPNWGVAIILMTILLKIATLPFTLAASRSAKRMQKLMPLMTELREKFKDNPAKMQEGMMRLYKEHKVNPLGGCIPILITMPFFIGFFTMLQSSADLRFASFLWVKDLAAPDSVVSFGTVTLPLLGLTHLSINILPIILGVTNFFQIRMTPTPTTDPAQATMMKVMPWMFMLFCYNFAAALSLYSTMNGLLTILQQWAINRMPEPQLATPVAADGMKNVTPKKKK